MDITDIIIEKAIRRAKNITIKKYPKRIRARVYTINKINTFCSVIKDSLRNLIKKVDTSNYTIFQRELLNLIVPLEKIEKSIDVLNGIIKRIENAEEKYIGLIKKETDKNRINEYRKQLYGFVISQIKRKKKYIQFLEKAYNEMKKIPNVKDEFTVVISGAPNVGKSTLLKALTGSEPEIAPYPFTTKNILLGYIRDLRYEIQIVDTPGLLDRRIEDKNPIEKRAILALRHLANIIIFVFDPSETCGYGFDYQKRVYQSIKEYFPDKKLIVVINKIDLFENDSYKKYGEMFEDETYFCSALKGIGVDKLKEKILSEYEKSSGNRR